MDQELNNFLIPTEKSRDYLLAYENEKCDITEQIKELVSQITNNNQLHKNELAGWFLERKYCEHTGDGSHKTEYAYVLCVDGTFRRFESEYSEYNEKYNTNYFETYEIDSTDLLQEFDYSGYFSIPYNRGNAIHIIKSTLAWNPSCATLTRISKKGVGLYNVLRDIKEKNIAPEIISRPRMDEYNAQLEENTKKEQKTSGGCYIATCVYGDYDCPEVWILRRFRDFILAKTWHGRIFIKIYYLTSPIIVKCFGKTNWFKNICKQPLDKMIGKLKDEGFSDKPYNDI